MTRSKSGGHPEVEDIDLWPLRADHHLPSRLLTDLQAPVIRLRPPSELEVSGGRDRQSGRVRSRDSWVAIGRLSARTIRELHPSPFVAPRGLALHRGSEVALAPDYPCSCGCELSRAGIHAFPADTDSGDCHHGEDAGSARRRAANALQCGATVGHHRLPCQSPVSRWSVLLPSGSWVSSSSAKPTARACSSSPCRPARLQGCSSRPSRALFA